MPGRSRFVTDIAVAPHGRSWAVKHNGGFLGYAKSESEAMKLAQGLVDWIMDQGRAVTLANGEMPTAPAVPGPAPRKAARPPPPLCTPHV